MSSLKVSSSSSSSAFEHLHLSLLSMHHMSPGCCQTPQHAHSIMSWLRPRAVVITVNFLANQPVRAHQLWQGSCGDEAPQRAPSGGVVEDGVYAHVVVEEIAQRQELVRDERWRS